MRLGKGPPGASSRSSVSQIGVCVDERFGWRIQAALQKQDGA